MKKRGDLQISFAWLFAIIVGAFILVLTIYGLTKITKTGGTETSVEAGKEISVLLNPLETSFEEATSTKISMPIQTRINNKCDNSGEFGTQGISLSQQSFGKWTSTDFNIESEN